CSKQRATPSQRGAQTARNIQITSNINNCLVLVDGVVSNKALHPWCAWRQSEGWRGVNITQGCAHARQKRSQCLFHILSRNALIQSRLLKAGCLHVSQPQGFV